MASISNIKTDITPLNYFELQKLFSYIGEILYWSSVKSTLNEDFKESRFSNGEACPHCPIYLIVKNGRLNVKQKYKCN